jgi:hypothetical protein
MNKDTICPVCNNAFGTTATIRLAEWRYRVQCPICGDFDLDRGADDDFLNPNSPSGKKLTVVQRARIAHRIRSSIAYDSSSRPHLTSNFLEDFIKRGCPGPSPAEQVTNAVRFIGSLMNHTGQRIGSLPREFFVLIGSPNPRFAGELLIELKARGVVDGIDRTATNVDPDLINVGLTLDGWQMFEDERRGLTAGSYGFLAMKFGDSRLDALARELIKPTLRKELGFDVFDMRDVARAGVIDNIMRAQIRDAAFVMVDLTHDNSGAYWEAGYAEGLGKPVIYICEKDKFEKVQTHFDTNHCTTVVWTELDPEPFKQQLVATLRRSLNLF